MLNWKFNISLMTGKVKAKEGLVVHAQSQMIHTITRSSTGVEKTRVFGLSLTSTGDIGNLF